MSCPTSREISWAVILVISMAGQGVLVGWSPLMVAAAIVVPAAYLFIPFDAVRMTAVSLGLGGAGMSAGGVFDQWLDSGTAAVCHCEAGHALVSSSTGLMMLACGLGCWYACPGCTRVPGAERRLRAGVVHGMMLAGMYAVLLLPGIDTGLGIHNGMVVGMGAGTLMGCSIFSCGRLLWANG